MSSPNNRNSIFGWVKNLKKSNLLSNDSINEISDFSSEDITSQGYKTTNDTPAMNAKENELLRPILNHKSRSTNNVNRVRSNSQSDNDIIRQNRDSFLMNNPLIEKNSKYFGVSLGEAVNQASAKISIFTNEDSGEVLKYGRIPIIVAKCGIYLKTNGLNVEGIFRVGGSTKRLKDLQVIFNTPPDFGKKLSWDGYTVHDAASILRRYLNSLPEPLIPLELYEEFRSPLRDRSRIISYMKYKATHPKNLAPTNLQSNNETINALTTTNYIAKEVSNSEHVTEKLPSTPKMTSELPSPTLTPNDIIEEADDEEEDTKVPKSDKRTKNYRKLTRDVHDAIDEYKLLVEKLPILSKQLLFYILDLLAMVQNHSGENLMSSRNLAAIFQPSILSHPSHDLDPTEYALSQFVVEFLIQYAYKLLPQNSENAGSNSRVEKTDSTPNSSTANSNDKNLNTVEWKRQHSKSLSSSGNHEDLVGYENNQSSKQLPIVDNFFMTDLDDDEDKLKATSGIEQFEPPKEIDELTINQINDEVKDLKINGDDHISKPDIIISTPSSPSKPQV